MKIRIKFKKYGVMKFIGHLDMMRYFQKAIRRSNIGICFSEGYSPHMVMSFAAPLGVGITSDGEYLDIEVHDTMSSHQALLDLNAVMTEGIEVTGYVLLPDRARPAMSIVTASDYDLTYKEGYRCPYPVSELRERLHAFFEAQDEVLITKKTKKGEKTMDLKKLVYAFEVNGQQDKPEFYLNVSTGSTDNLKPELVLEAFFHSLGTDYDPFAIQLHRRDVYFTDETGRHMPLLAEGTVIA